MTNLELLRYAMVGAVNALRTSKRVLGADAPETFRQKCHYNILETEIKRLVDNPDDVVEILHGEDNIDA